MRCYYKDIVTSVAAPVKQNLSALTERTINMLTEKRRGLQGLTLSGKIGVALWRSCFTLLLVSVAICTYFATTAFSSIDTIASLTESSVKLADIAERVNAYTDEYYAYQIEDFEGLEALLFGWTKTEALDKLEQASEEIRQAEITVYGLIAFGFAVSLFCLFLFIKSVCAFVVIAKVDSTSETLQKLERVFTSVVCLASVFNHSAFKAVARGTLEQQV
jgi:hypothetical protein